MSEICAANDEMDALFGSDDENETSIPNSLSYLEMKEPLAEIKTIKNIGGERGLFAKFDIPAGCLIISEIPVIVWPECDLTEVDNLVQVLQLVCSNQQAIDTTRNLHPRNIEDADEAEILNINETISEDILQQIASDYHLSIAEVKRIYLTLQHNGFGSGLYEFLSIANHSCDPNCIKFMPQTSTANQMRDGSTANRHTTASEIWSTRNIQKGEEITICYCVPLEMTNSAMHTFLLQHHRFVCQCNKCLNSSLNTCSTLSSMTLKNDTLSEKTESKTNIQALFNDIALVNAQYYQVSEGENLSNEEFVLATHHKVTEYLAREGLRMLSGHPPSIRINNDNAHNNTDSNTTVDQTASETVATAEVTSDVTTTNEGESSNIQQDSASLYVENEISLMESELLWYKAEDPANNLKTYSAMVVACEYLLSYYGEYYCTVVNTATSEQTESLDSTNSILNDISINSTIHSCVAQLSARILKVSLQAVFICLEMIDIIRSQASSEQSRSYNIISRLKCKKYIENIKIDKLLFPFIIEVFTKNALQLLQFQHMYLGNLHPDISTTYHDIVQGIELLVANCSESECTEFWNMFENKQNIVNSLSLANVLLTKNVSGLTKQHLNSIIKLYKKEGDKVKALYSTLKRFPESVRGVNGGVNRVPGTVYWGTKQAMDKLYD